MSRSRNSTAFQESQGKEMRKVTLPKGSPRGGVLTHASVLMVTSNPTRTSPVKSRAVRPRQLPGYADAPAAGRPGNPQPGRGRQGSQGRADHAGTDGNAPKHAAVRLLPLPHGPARPGPGEFQRLGMYREKEHGQPIDAAGKLITGEEFQERRRVQADSERIAPARFLPLLDRKVFDLCPRPRAGVL